MGFLKDVGHFAGGAFGIVVGGATCFVAGALNSQMLKEVGEGVITSSIKAGETVGQFADGAVGAAAGVVVGDADMQRQGCKDMGGAVVDTAVGVGRGIVHVCKNGTLAVEGVVTGDAGKVLTGGAELVKTAAIATLALGVLDIIDVSECSPAEIADADLGPHHLVSMPEVDTEPHLIENPNTHFVEAHSRLLPSGETIWVDGDGDTSIASRPGWVQHNPDYRA